MRSAAKVARASRAPAAGSLSPVSPAASIALLLEALDGLLLGLLGLGDRVVGVGDPEGQRRLVRGGGDDQHLGALDLLAEHRAHHVRVDRLGGEDEQLHVASATPAPVGTNDAAPGSARATETTATSSRRTPSWIPSDGVRDAAGDPGRRPAGPGADQVREALGPERVVGGAGLDDAVGVEDERVARVELGLDRLDARARARCRAACPAARASRPARRRAGPAAADGRRWRPRRPTRRPGASAATYSAVQNR